MAEVMNMPVESLEQRDLEQQPLPTKPTEQPQSPPPPSPPPRRRDRDSRDDRDLDRHPNRRVGGDYYDRNRSPLPLRDRERDYRRRSSPSPPPYRDRRHSPPRRSPPPPYKRSRRDDGGYDGRRGSPRGGFGGGNRRFGYDYAGGNDREMGGRHGYADERSHGRYMGRPSGGYQDWDSGRGGVNDSFNAGTSQREGLMSYKQFIQELEDDILPAEAERRYQEYKSEYISTQKRTFFDTHKDEEWLKDKYHPTNLVNVIDRRNDFARKAAKDFFLDLQSGTLDFGPGVNALLSKSGQISDQNTDDEVDIGGKRRRHGRGSTKETDINSDAPKAHPVTSEPRRIQVDMEQALALVRNLDSEKGIEENLLSRVENDRTSREKSHAGSIGPVVIIRGLTSVKGLEGIELLDALLTYLWRIHGVDYYGRVEMTEAKGLRHVREEGKGSSDGTEWEKKLDSHWEERLRGQDPLEVMAAKEKIDSVANEGLDPYVRKIRDEKYGWKYGCGAKSCTKLFHAAEFVHKHLKLKHTELVLELTSKVREDLYFQNYMNDADAPGGTPIMQQSLPKDRPQRRRPGVDNRMKDELGNRRGEWVNSGGERFNRSENPQDNGDGPDGGDADDPKHAAHSFPSDIQAPQILMPVPGAGPLGPFVPAPPEVAMRMMREQGAPFEGGTRNGAPFLALPSGFRQDSRRIRSYQDLDAPDDEVTVIDYRSL